jgi:D-arabinose 5-phosphate isomerase GutQ
MKSGQQHPYLRQAAQVLQMESQAVNDQVKLLGEEFIQVVDLILGCTGRVVVTGMGKSGLVGRKLSATLSSTGTPSFFLHPAEAIHGDLGMVTAQDVIIAISNSGENSEVLFAGKGGTGSLLVGAGPDFQHYRDFGRGRRLGGGLAQCPAV